MRPNIHDGDGLSHIINAIVNPPVARKPPILPPAVAPPLEMVDRALSPTRVGVFRYLPHGPLYRLDYIGRLTSTVSPYPALRIMYLMVLLVGVV